MSLKEIKEKSEPIKVIEEKITKEKYDEAVLILQKQEEAKAIIEAFEMQERFENDPISEIMEKGVKTIEGTEEIPGRNICRITAFRFEFEGKTVIQTLEYLNAQNDKNFLALKNEKIEML